MSQIIALTWNDNVTPHVPFLSRVCLWDYCPFSKHYKRSWLDPQEPFFLVASEIQFAFIQCGLERSLSNGPVMLMDRNDHCEWLNVLSKLLSHSACCHGMSIDGLEERKCKRLWRYRKKVSVIGSKHLTRICCSESLFSWWICCTSFLLSWWDYRSITLALLLLRLSYNVIFVSRKKNALNFRLSISKNVWASLADTQLKPHVTWK